MAAITEGGGAEKMKDDAELERKQLDDILLDPATYIGSVEKQTRMHWVYEGGGMVERNITYSPGLYKIFDEILVNAIHRKCEPPLDFLKVDIDAAGCCISVHHNGRSFMLPVQIDERTGLYIPEMFFSDLSTGSRFDAQLLSNIFSSEFVIEIADGYVQKKYKQVFSGNMRKKSKPEIKNCKQSETWTKITFKPDITKFTMSHLEKDVVALMKKRVVDMAGTHGKTVKVELDGWKIPAKGFKDYVNLFIKSAPRDDCELPRFYQKINEHWEVGLSVTDGQFQQVSFVNGFLTTKGGSHVDFITNEVVKHMMSINNNKMEVHTIKNHLWIFVNVIIDEAAFDSLAKESLTTHGSFESDCPQFHAFLENTVHSGFVTAFISWVELSMLNKLTKSNETKMKTPLGIDKLEDANNAGGIESGKCTLILTEGDSAKALAMAGLGVVGRDTYGVFPLRGKLVNVRGAKNTNPMLKNQEIKNLMQILGLEVNKDYKSTKELRYGHVMIMTDQDLDGTHIKGLVINFIHCCWPSLLRVPSFLLEFITPIMKASHINTGTVIPFYSIPDYEAWRQAEGENISSWTIKYYKGLGSSTGDEGRDYFSNISQHKKEFVWGGDRDGQLIDMAFNSTMVTERKRWLSNYKPGDCLDHKEKYVKYSDFINKRLIHFSMSDNYRSIPSMVDGLKPGQRKILFCLFKKNCVEEIKVEELIGYVLEHSAYHHGEKSLAGTIVGMAQNFVGSNNINLLVPSGQFGTRYMGGDDVAAARYMCTKLAPITRFIFPMDDDVLLEYLNEDGKSVEPNWFLPIIPMVLVNGAKGIGTGWSTTVPNYDPRIIIAKLKMLINRKSALAWQTETSKISLVPHYRGFKGSMDEDKRSNATSGTYIMTGLIKKLDDTTLRITEIPISFQKRNISDYKNILESMCVAAATEEEGKARNNQHPLLLQEVRSRCDDNYIDFELVLSKDNMNIAEARGLEKTFNLTSTIGTSNMYLFNSNGKIQKYDTPEDVLQEFYRLRLPFYQKRKDVLLKWLKDDLSKVRQKVAFVEAVLVGDINIFNRNRDELCLELKRKGYIPFESGYDYLLSMPIATFTTEKIKELTLQKRHLLDCRMKNLKNTSPEDLWLRDLDALEKQLDVLEAETRADEQKRAMRESKSKDEELKAAPTKMAGSDDEDYGASILEPAAQKNRPAKKVHESEMKDRVAAYSTYSSSDLDGVKETRGINPAVDRKRLFKETRQKLIVDFYKPSSDDHTPSPDKKVRKIKFSPP